MKYAIRAATLVLALGLAVCFAPSAKAQGACPTGSNYIDLTNPSSGGGYGSVALSSGNAGGIASCWYFSSSGSSSNTGTSESSPCLYLPGMASFPASGTCHMVPAPGEGFIIEGGSVYHRQTGAPLIGGTWTWSASGNSSNYIYVGIDPSWYIGSSFTRPQINWDNPLNNGGPVASCTYSTTGAQISVTGSYVILDGFDLSGLCASTGDANYIEPTITNHQVYERTYVHGWTYPPSPSDDGIVAFGDIANRNSTSSNNRFLFDVVDGADSTFGSTCNTSSCVGNSGGGFISDAASGWAFGDGYDIEYSVIRHVSNGIQAGDICILIGNLMEYEFEPSLAGNHGNVIEANFGGCSVGLYYNNITRNVNEGINWSLNASTFYLFNNVWFNDGHYPPDPNGLFPMGPGRNGTAVVAAYITNNTFQDTRVNAAGLNASWDAWAPGSAATFENNHILDFTSISSFFMCSSGSTCTKTDSGGEIFQTTSAANNQGYTFSNNFAPTSGTDSTVDAGSNLTSFCATIPNTSATAACERGAAAATEQAGWGGQMALYSDSSVNSRSASGSWDSGAYQFNSGAVSGPPSPAGGLGTSVR